ncbi:MAG: glycosyltransferase family 4 protein [Ignavibacteria bacterium]|nr:glycosyltransferase family 4 protein [Ignavibacteria bacterium]
MKHKIVVLCFNYEPSQFPVKPDTENRFYTYGFGSTFGRLFNNYLKQYSTEVWRIDGYCKEKYYEKNIDNIKYRVFKAAHLSKLGYFSWNYIKELKREKQNHGTIFFVVHTHNWQTYQAAYFLKGAKIITTHHGDWSPFFLYNNTTGLRKVKALLGKMAEKLTFKNISYFLICDINQVKFIKMAYPGFKYEIFSTGLDIHRFKNITRNEARDLLKLDKNKKYILYVGKLYKYKQVDKLIEIWLEIKKSKPETELLIVGNEEKGKWGEEYYDLAERSGAIIVGRVLNIELYKYYCAADVYVLLNLRDDYFGGIGIAPLESLACNTPVVSNALKNYLGPNLKEIGEIPESLEDYKNSILNILNDPNRFVNMRESVDRFYSLEAVADRMERIFIIFNNK